MKNIIYTPQRIESRKTKRIFLDIKERELKNNSK